MNKVQEVLNCNITSSKEVAKIINKPHSEVLAYIKQVDSEEVFHKINNDEYTVNKDGLMLIVMTLSDDLLWKLEFIQEFNRMESEIRKLIPKSIELDVREMEEVVNNIKGDKDGIRKDYIKLFDILEDNSEVKAALYKKYERKQLE